MADEVMFFEAHRRVYPRDIWGRYRQLKWLAMAVLLAIYYFVPFIRWDRGPQVPNQAILIDMAGRRAYFFFIEIWPQEVFYLTGLLILAAVGLFFVTSMFGRVWCGYACPQTVWTDLFIKVEYFFQGDRNARMKLESEKWTSFNKIWRKCATHVTWIVIGLFTGGAWTLYFNDAPTLVHQILTWAVPWNVGGWIIGLTASTYIMAGYAREHVCMYMCPYARFQSAMFDRDTLIITYETERGEPRGSHKAGESWEKRGHCVDCHLCVAVCPMGIDIRQGLQMSCIACGLCVDACNSIMDKVGLPRGLIRYDTEHNHDQRIEAQKAGRSYRDRLRVLRPRTFYYVSILVIVGSVMLFSLMTRDPYDLHVLHERNPLFVKLSNGGIRNNYTIKILNKSHTPRTFVLEVEGLPDPVVRVEGAGHPDIHSLSVPADNVAEYTVMITVPDVNQMKERQNALFKIVDKNSGQAESRTTMFIIAEPRP